MKLKRVLSAVLTLMLVLSTLCNIHVFAANVSYPTASSSQYIEFKAQENINVYQDTACKTRGTSNPSKKYDAYIAKNDVCYIYKIASSYVEVNYPTSSGRRTGFIKRSALFDKTTPEEYIASAKASVTVKYADGSSSISKGDKVWCIDPKKEYGGYKAVIYEAKSGKRAYKIGYVTLNNLEKIKKEFLTTSDTEIAKRIEDFMSDSRWKMKTNWANRKPYLSPYNCSQCMAYAADFAKYVYDADSPKGGTKYTNINDIKVGDTIHVWRTAGGYGHWMVCIAKSGNSITVIHGNWTGGKACKSTFTISGNMIGTGSRFMEGYHFN